MSSYASKVDGQPIKESDELGIVINARPAHKSGIRHRVKVCIIHHYDELKIRLRCLLRK